MAGLDPLATWEAVRRYALSFPEAFEDHPWGETVVKANRKVFVFIGSGESDNPGMTVKLSASLDHALSIKGATPAGYGLGKAGWVSLPLAGLDLDLLGDWIEESYRAVTPKRLAARLDDRQQRNLPTA